MKSPAIGNLLVVLSLAACGGGSTPGPGDANAPDSGVGGVQDQDPGTPGDVAPTIDTRLSAEAVRAGDPVDVACEGVGFNPKKVVIRVWEAPPPEAPPTVPEGGDAATAPDATAAPDPFTPPEEPPEGVTVQDHRIVATRTGLFRVRCEAPDAGLVDETPAGFVVTAAAPFSVETAVEPHDIRAGEWVTVTCTGWDVYGNEVDGPFAPITTPNEGITTSGLTVQLTKAVLHRIACGVVGAPVSDPTPEEVTVRANVPKKIYTSVTPDTFQAGGQAEVACTATDYYDNPVPDLPMSVYLPPKMSIHGKFITTNVTGMYPVKCVPQNIEWKYFQLYGVTVLVTPGDPVKLTLKVVPDKQYYGTGSVINVTATATDAYDNLIPDAMVGVPAIDPPGGIEPSPNNPTKTFVLKEEGVYVMTFRLLQFPAVSASLTIRVEGSGPLLSILYPERGATIQGKPSVTVMGIVNDDITGIESFTINGQPVTNVQPDGTFTFLMNPVQGLNMIDAQVTNGAGMSSRVRQSYYFSFVYYPIDASNPEKGMVHNSVRAFLGRDFFDDGDHDPTHPDDLATILETFISKLNINALIPSPIAESGPYKVYLSNVTFGKPRLQIGLYDGGMRLYVVLPNLHLDVKLKGECNFIIDWCPDFSGDVSVSQITVTADVLLWTGSDKKVHAQMQSADVGLSGIDVDIDGIVGWLFGWLIDILVDQFTSDIEKAFEQQMGDLINNTLEDLFSKFELNETIEIPPLLGNNPAAITILTRPQDLTVKTDGMRISMEGTLTAPKGVNRDVLGSISRANCLTMKPPTFDLPHQSEIEFGAFDDLLNEGLFSVWWSGAINVTITPEDLGDVDLSQYGVSDLFVTLDFYLPPILTDCHTPGNLQVQVGDLYVVADLKFNGIPLKIGVFVYAAASVRLEAVPNAEGGNDVAITVLGLDLFELEFVSIESCQTPGAPCEDMSAMKDGLEALIKEVLLPPLLEDVIGKPLASFPIPTIDLATLDPSLPPGIELTFVVEDLYREEGFTVATGHLE